MLARVANHQGEALERLSRALDGFGAPATPRVVELTSPKGMLQLLSHEIGRAERSVLLHAPVEAYPLLAPVLRRAASAGLSLALVSPGAVTLPFASVEVVPDGHAWPGAPLVAVIDERSAVIASRQGAEVGRGTGAARRRSWPRRASRSNACGIPHDRRPERRARRAAARVPVRNAQAYLNRLELLCQVPMAIVSTGPERDETILRQHPFN